MTGPTGRQIEVLGWIDAHQRVFGYAITVRELGEALDVASTNCTQGHLVALRRKGLVEGTGRALTITATGRAWIEKEAA